MGKYNMPFNQYKTCMKMTKNEFSRWVDSFANTMWNQGYSKAMEGAKVVSENAVVIDDPDTMVIDINEEQIRDMLLSVPGVGNKLCEKIIDKIYETFDGYVQEESDEKKS